MRNLTMPNVDALAAFVAWQTRNITGDEKGQAQIYLDRLFQACGHAGVLDAGAANVKQINSVVAAAREVRRIRGDALSQLKGGLRALYRTLELPGANPLKHAHSELDAAVLAAYGFSQKRDLLAQLLSLNLRIASEIANGRSVCAPGVPTGFPDVSRLVSTDCIQAPS